MFKLGIVVIGRNEGERLVRCLASVAGPSRVVVYVDSGSTDGSVEAARRSGVDTVLLDPSVSFTAARARNLGFHRLLELQPETEFVQFVDGDCEIEATWLERAAAELNANPTVAVVCGRRRERHPDHSRYNRLCDMEWDTPVGEALACGGDAMFRAQALRQVGGYRDTLIAGEEPELCCRLRGAGWTVLRLGAEMTVHDAAMTRFGQWRRRTTRAGYAYAEVSRLQGPGRARIWVREFWSNWLWGLALPLFVLAVTPLFPAILLLFLVYPLQALRVARGRLRRGDSFSDARLFATFCVLAKFPMAFGQALYYRDRLLGRRRALIEYKDAFTAVGPLRVAYLVNQYPHVSHSFIRREILALEERGVEVVRVSVRRPSVKLVDAGDQKEEQRTWVLLDAGLFGVAWGCVQTAVRRPIRLARAMFLTARLGRRSGRVLRPIIYLAEACLLLRRLQRERAEHLHAHFGTNSTDVALLTRTLGGPPFSFTVHGPEEFDRPEAISLSEKIARSAFVVAISSYGRSQLFRWARPADWPRVHVVRCGVDDTFLAGGPLPPVAVPRLVCVGRLAEQKGQLLLIDAAARLASTGVDFQLVLAGDGHMRPQIEAAIKAHGLTERVRITGWLSNEAVRAEMAAARLFVLPSFAEGLPVVLMESLALGRAVVTTFVAGIPELVKDGVTGWLVPAGDPVALASALSGALRTDEDGLSRMGIEGAAAVRAAHDARREAALLGELFLGSCRRAPPPNRQFPG